MIGKILDFLFGKSPDIFDVNGNVVHKRPTKKWQAWRDRFEKNQDFKCRQHKGTERNISKTRKK